MAVGAVSVVGYYLTYFAGHPVAVEVTLAAVTFGTANGRRELAPIQSYKIVGPCDPSTGASLECVDLNDRDAGGIIRAAHYCCVVRGS